MSTLDSNARLLQADMCTMVCVFILYIINTYSFPTGANNVVYSNWRYLSLDVRIVLCNFCVRQASSQSDQRLYAQGSSQPSQICRYVYAGF